MKKEDLLQAMQGIDELDIENSEKKMPVRRHFRGLEMLAACACLLLIVGAIYQINTGLGTQEKTQHFEESIENAEMEGDQVDGEQEAAVIPYEESTIWKGKTEYLLRKQVCDRFEDISDPVNAEYNEESVDVAGLEGKIIEYADEERTIVCLWYDDQEKMMYALSASGVDKKTILQVAKNIVR